jgi:hypothetical protein
MKLTVYGSFNCPYSFLANLRVERLSSLGVADVEWPAVGHDPDVPPGGLPVVGELAGMFDRELDEIRCGSTSPTRPDVRRCSRTRRSPSRVLDGHRCRRGPAAGDTLRRLLGQRPRPGRCRGAR